MDAQTSTLLHVCAIARQLTTLFPYAPGVVTLVGRRLLCLYMHVLGVESNTLILSAAAALSEVPDGDFLLPVYVDHVLEANMVELQTRNTRMQAYLAAGYGAAFDEATFMRTYPTAAPYMTPGPGYGETIGSWSEVPLVPN